MLCKQHNNSQRVAWRTLHSKIRQHNNIKDCDAATNITRLHIHNVQPLNPHDRNHRNNSSTRVFINHYSNPINVNLINRNDSIKEKNKTSATFLNFPSLLSSYALEYSINAKHTNFSSIPGVGRRRYLA